jgi:inositol transport system substrate-binding protein
MPSVWIVFSSTPYKLGRFIRGVLGTQFNHISLSFNPSLAPMYSFARRYINAPLVGGFVTESYRRFQYLNNWADIKVCRIDLTEQQHHRLRVFVASFKRHDKECIYNLYSAATAPLKKRVRLRGCYTCVEFVCDALAYAGVKGFCYNAFHALDTAEYILSPHVIYEGSAKDYPGGDQWGEDTFAQRRRKRTVLKDTATTFARLFARGVRALHDHFTH